MSWKDILNVESLIVNASLKKYKELSKGGKPILHETKAEWTVLASIVMIQFASMDKYDIKVISIGTGLKCLPYSKLVKTGDQLNDSHAEIIAKRGFIKFLLDQVIKLRSGTNEASPFILQEDGTLIQDANYTFHMYISHSPCGDASMSVLAQVQSEESFNNFESGSHKRKRSNELHQEYPFLVENIYANKRQRKENSQKTLQRGRFKFDQLGILRTKPGRLDSEPTLCMSCSDKLARWNVLGLQSALLSTVFKNSVYLASIVIGDMFDKEALERALYKRMVSIQDLLPKPYKLNQPIISATEIPFESSKTNLEATGKYSSIISCSTSISWVIGMPLKKAEVFVNGRKQGAPKGKPINSKTRPSICKKSLLEKYLQLSEKEEEKKKTYYEWKQKSTLYQKAKECLLDNVFDTWVQTPKEYEEFFI